MESNAVIQEALQFTPAQKFIVIEALIKSLDVTNPAIEAEWAEEANKRLKAYRAGELETISFEEMFK